MHYTPTYESPNEEGKQKFRRSRQPMDVADSEPHRPRGAGAGRGAGAAAAAQQAPTASTVEEEGPSAPLGVKWLLDMLSFPVFQRVLKVMATKKSLCAQWGYGGDM